MNGSKNNMRLCVVYKRSVYQKYVLERHNKNLMRLLKRQHPATKSMVANHKRHVEVLEKMRNLLAAQGLKAAFLWRHNTKAFGRYDLVITVGGDGTLLRASHFVDHQLLLGINSVPESSVGALCGMTFPAFSKNLPNLLHGLGCVRQLPRIKITLNGKALPVEPINDILFTNSSPAATSRYLLSLGSHREEQKSSGLWVATATGSSAAMLAAGGERQNRGDQRLQYIIREPYQATAQKPYRLLHGFFETKAKLKIISKMIRARLYLDGPTVSYTVNFGDEICMELSDRRLNLVFPE